MSTSGSPRLIHTKAALRSALGEARSAAGYRADGSCGLSVGLVPTMGFLHDGHLSLVRRARAECDMVVMTIFVNPMQFGPHEDLEKYPRDTEHDLGLAAEAGVDLVFQPGVSDMYAPEHATWVEVEGLADHLCGASRPGHFRGVATVVTKLLCLSRPDRAYFGQKDAQQALLLKRMVADLDLGAELIICPTVREPDGLALSSRNVYLSPEERAQAPVLHWALEEATAEIAGGERDPRMVVSVLLSRLADAPLCRVDYAEVVSVADLQPVDVIEGEVLVAAAVWFGGTRLIDNAFGRPPGRR
jgi:pantoate--beta-alanine ligase